VKDRAARPRDHDGAHGHTAAAQTTRGQEAGMTDASVVRMSVRQDASKLRRLGLS